mgnify:CR=1 FL=1
MAKASPAAPTAAAALPPANGDWHGLLENLKLGGMVRELAHHCVLAEQTENAIKLRRNPAHKSLLMNKATQDKLQGALAAYFGKPVRLAIEIGDLSSETPAQRAENARSEKQNRAIESIEQDAFVRDMIETFDATINEQSIKPL